ncbi:hypothetical protein QWZ08_16255 [Ferruginibacter paludis]|uniref:hypothetical protein n=1 Tax=Ferruginibacter paludis TaxID=1310417 RepID=UPI0025B4D6A7|nr:hypothetical protein [Ferruginibacter paludis]MDN3657203.1 hypothetical protein [Ferruginibacter paludis]
MENLVLKNEKEKLFLNKLILSKDIYDYPEVKNEKEFRHYIIFRNHERSWVLDQLYDEVEDNLLLLSNKDSRTVYLRRLLKNIERIKLLQNERIDAFNEKMTEDYEFVLSYPGKPQIVFSTSKIILIHSIAAGLFYLDLFELFVTAQLEIELQTEEISLVEKVNFEDLINDAFIRFIYSMQRDLKVSKLLKADFAAYEKREDSRTSYLFNKFEVMGELKCNYQHHIGSSGTGKTEGIADFSISDITGKPIALCEAFNHEALNKKVVKEHLTKIFSYNSQRLNLWYVIIYYEGNFKDFHTSYNNYLEYVNNIEFEFKLEQIRDITETFSAIQSEGIKVAKAKHFWNKDKLAVSNGFHFFIDISGNSK